jgi:hypothetical protein
MNTVGGPLRESASQGALGTQRGHTK